MSTEVRIGHIENLHLTVSPEMASPVLDEMQRGVDPEVLADIGMPVPEGGQLALPVESNPDEEADRIEMLAEQSKQDEINAHNRKTQLIQLVKEVGDQRRLEGFIVNHENEPNDRGRVEDKNFDKQQRSRKTLERACGSCALADNCAIKGNIGAWTHTHPYANSDKRLPYTGVRYPQVKETESRMKFLKRLNKDPLAHCVPTPTKKKAA